MEIYHLTKIGKALANNYRSSNNDPKWLVIHFLDKRGVATKEQIYENVPNVNSVTLAKLRIKRVIAVEEGVSV